MNINITGRHVEITPALRDYAQQKFERLQKHFEKIISIHVILGVDKLVQKAEVTLHIPHNDLHAESESVDMYSSIDLLVDKVNRQLLKHKEKADDRR